MWPNTAKVVLNGAKHDARVPQHGTPMAGWFLFSFKIPEVEIMH